MKNFSGLAILAMLVSLITGCGSVAFKASTNNRAGTAPPIPSQQASFELRDERIKQLRTGKKDCSPKKHKDVLVVLALSGGGSRAALLSGLSMIEMQQMKLANGSNLLAEVDLISSVSGGSMPAGYYAISGDPDPKDECSAAVSNRVWNEAEVTALMSKDYLGPWIRNWFWPDNILLYWFSTYDRTDMMAQTFADNLYDVYPFGRDLRFNDLNASRPNLVINATQGSVNSTAKNRHGNGFGQPFTFTREDFSRVCSSIDDYELARGVMASATFPGVFNFMTLQNYCDQERYVHLFDAGNADNLGLTSIKRLIWNLHEAEKLSRYKKIVVVLVDAYTDASGVSEEKNDPRHWFDFIIDTNFIIATDSLLAKNRDSLINQFKTGIIFPYGVDESLSASNSEKITIACKSFFSWEKPETAARNCSTTGWNTLNSNIDNKLRFVHINFDNVKDDGLRNQLNNIATSFKLGGGRNEPTKLNDKEAIICAVPTLFGRDVEANKAAAGHSNKCPNNYSASPEVKILWQRTLAEINQLAQ